jgi:hypothetical protein
MPFRLPHHLGERYSPLYFLAALGAGGLAVSFFMWLLFWIPRAEGRPVPVFEDVSAAFASGDPLLQGVVVAAAAGIALFALMHVRLLIWNIGEYSEFRRTEAYRALRAGNAETQLLAAPLTVAMAINVGFVLGLVFVPGLWSVVEYLFPLALVAFVAVGAWAVSLLADFWGRVLTKGGFDCSKNNSFAQMLPAFALSMVGVGLAAPASMSQTAWVAGVSYLLSSAFIVTAVALGAVKLVLGVRAMMEQGASVESAPTLWIVVPILTVIGIATMRQGHGLHAHFGAHVGPAETFQTLTTFLVVQLAFLGLGWVVLKRFDYFARFVRGAEMSAGAYALVCPGVALSVMLHFFVNKGLVGIGLIPPFGAAYWAVTGVALLSQALTVALVFRLNARHFSARVWAARAAQPA